VLNDALPLRPRSSLRQNAMILFAFNGTAEQPVPPLQDSDVFSNILRPYGLRSINFAASGLLLF
jgi:hypothetical protein